MIQPQQPYYTASAYTPTYYQPNLEWWQTDKGWQVIAGIMMFFLVSQLMVGIVNMIKGKGKDQED